MGVGVARESLRTAHWFGGRNGPKQAWTGGTLTSVELGSQLNSRGHIPWRLWRQYARYAGRTASGEPALLKDLSDKYLGPACRPLQDAIDLVGNGGNSYWDFLAKLAEADMCIPGPGLHNSSWAGAEWDTSAELAKYREILEPLRYPEYLRQVHRLHGNRQQVVKAARSHLRACVNHLAGRPPNSRRTLSVSLRARAVKRSFDEELRFDAVAFAHHIDKIGDNDRTGVAEALYTYLLARWFGFMALEAAGSAHRLEEALEEAARACPVGQPLP